MKERGREAMEARSSVVGIKTKTLKEVGSTGWTFFGISCRKMKDFQKW